MMAKRRRGYNAKARQNPETVVDRSTEKKIKLDPKHVTTDQSYDDSNVLALPVQKRMTKKVGETDKTVKRLGKKERKRLEKIVEQKAKKAKRAMLLESLSKVQASAEEMSMFMGIAEMQSGTHKRRHEVDMKTDTHGEVKTIGKSKKQKKIEKLQVVEESEESEDSVDTSDISTDDETTTCETEKQDSLEHQPPIEIETEATNTAEMLSAGENRKDKDSNALKAQVIKGDKSEPARQKIPAVHVPVTRSSEVQEARLKLPILGEEQMIMENISEHPVVIICGETGSGKTTQVPQFLYEAGYAHGEGIIAVTEPRRVAAVSMSKRVAMEMNVSSNMVSYQIRYEGNVTDRTKIKFMTDGVLLKEVQQDFLLTKYSVVIIDEAHERSVYTDILIGLLSRIVPLREKRGKPLKLIIMSATLRVEDFTENKRLFRTTPPVVKVDSRQFPVTIHFNKRTPVDSYLSEAYKKVCKIHRMLPEGGILVFVTGQQEVHTLCRKLKQTFPCESSGQQQTKAKVKVRHKEKYKDKRKAELPPVCLDNYSVEPIDEETQREADVDSDMELTENLEDDDDDDDDVTELGEGTKAFAGGCTDPLYTLPLYSLLASDKQMKVFDPPPEGCRLCIVATNVAETSLTIPNVRYVIDTGKVKTKFYDKVTGVSTFKITWTSKAGANQRAGRAGRVGPGHSYRLYSSAVFNDEFQQFSPAEITRRPVDDLVLQMKDMNIDRVVNFPYPTPPDIEQLKAAEKLLVSLGAITEPSKFSRLKDQKKEGASTITPLGRAMANFPVSPRYAKMLSLAHQHDLLPYVIAIVAALSVDEVLVEPHRPAKTSEEKDELKKKFQHILLQKKAWAGTGHSLLLGDLMVMLKAVGSAEFEGGTPGFCVQQGIRYKAMREIRKLRAQLTNAASMVIPGLNICVDPKMAPPTDLQAKLLRQIVLSGLADHVARKCPEPLPGTDESTKKDKNPYLCMELEEPVYIHPASVLFRQNPDMIVYQHIQESSKLYMKGLSAIEPEWLPVFAPAHCSFSKPLDDPPPDYDEVKGHVTCHMTSTFSRCCWGVPATKLDYPFGLDRFRWFARFLLEGKVIPKLKQFVPLLLSLPSTMIKSWAKLQPKTESLLQALIGAGVDSKEALLNAWKNNPKYLLKEYLEWIPKAKEKELRHIWPPL